MVSSDREFWFRIGQQVKAAKEKRQAIEREREHNRLSKATQEINPAIAPQLRAALEKAKNGN